MNESTTMPRPAVCERTLQLFHRRLDGDLMEATERQAMEAHLTVCSECRETTAELSQVHDLLQGLSEQPLPEATLERVWDQTIRSEVATAESDRSRFLDWRLAAAAAVAVMMFAGWIGLASYSAEKARKHAEAELAAHEVRTVLRLTAQALERTGDAAIKDVFADSVSPALQRVGVRWPSEPRAAGNRPGAEL